MILLFKIQSYLLFLYHSKNQHGVHSPFVFQLVTKCLYKNKRESLKNKLFHYFQVKDVSLDGTIFPKDSSEKRDCMVINCKQYSENQLDIKCFLANCNNDTFFIFEEIYASKKANEFWKKCIQNNHFTVTIDTFRNGIAFVRKEQEKEHFVIRL